MTEEGKLKKRICGLVKTVCVHDDYEHPSQRHLDFKEIADVIDSAKKDFPSDDRIDEAIKIFEKIFFDLNKGFSSRWVLAVLQEFKESKKKWFGDKKCPL